MLMNRIEALLSSSNVSILVRNLCLLSAKVFKLSRAVREKWRGRERRPLGSEDCGMKGGVSEGVLALRDAELVPQRHFSN